GRRRADDPGVARPAAAAPMRRQEPAAVLAWRAAGGLAYRGALRVRLSRRLLLEAGDRARLADGRMLARRRAGSPLQVRTLRQLAAAFLRSGARSRPASRLRRGPGLCPSGTRLRAADAELAA